MLCSGFGRKTANFGKHIDSEEIKQKDIDKKSKHYISAYETEIEKIRKGDKRK